MTQTEPAILIIGPSWVGDMVMAQSLFRLIKSRSPETAIDVMAPAWSKPLLLRMPEVREALEMPFKHGEFKPGARLAVGKSLRNRFYHQAIVLPYTWKSALVPFGAKIPVRTGFVGEMRWGLLNDARKLDKQKLPMMVQRYVALGLAADESFPHSFPYPKLSCRAEDQQAVLRKLGLSKDQRPIVAFCPGAEYGPAKRWSPEYFAKVAQSSLLKEAQVWVFGSAKDKDIAEAIVREAPQVKNLAGKTELAEAIDLLGLADVVVSNDSGLMHISAALGKPVIAIFGSSDIHYTPPLSNNAHLLSLQLDCSPCFKRECPYGHYNCLRGITPERVIQELSYHLTNVEAVS